MPTRAAFAALGGIARRGIYDNMKTAVDKVKKGKGRIVNARFAAMCAHYLFDADFCNVASGWEKGVVEKNVQDSRRRIWHRRGQVSALAPSPNSMPGWATAAGRCGRRSRHPEHAAVQRGRDARARAAAPDADARALRRLRREAGAGVQHLPGSRWRATATRCRASWSGRWSARGCTRRSVVVVADDAVVASHERLSDRGADPLRLAALHPAGAEEARRAAQRRAVRRHARAAAAAAPGAAAPRGRRPRHGAGAGRRARRPGWTRCWWRWSWCWRPGHRRSASSMCVNVLGAAERWPAAASTAETALAGRRGTAGRHRPL